jgi:hypothetical protein
MYLQLVKKFTVLKIALHFLRSAFLYVVLSLVVKLCLKIRVLLVLDDRVVVKIE